MYISNMYNKLTVTTIYYHTIIEIELFTQFQYLCIISLILLLLFL